MDDHRDREGPLRVLLVAADLEGARPLDEILRAAWPEGLVVAHAQRLGDATHELLANAADCVLLDVAPPQNDAIDAVEQIRTAAPDVPLIVLTDREDETHAVGAVRAGAEDCLLKSELRPARLRQVVAFAIERKRSAVALTHQALHDALTGLPNRALFLDRLGVALDRSRRSGATVAVLFLDIDNFKQINDTLGHAAGDKLLVGLAERMRAMLRPMDTVARFGGDEFTFLFEDLSSEREVVLIADRISRAASTAIRLDGRETAVTVSIGIAMMEDPTTAAETVIREADAAMYRAKELGRSRYELYDEASRRRAMARMSLESSLRHALERGELRVHYQPKVALTEGFGVIGVEALVRWNHPDRGLIAPVEFVPVADETGLMVPIGQYVLEQALSRIGRWRRHRPNMTVSVNLSARQLEDAGLVSMLAETIRDADLEPDVLCLEVTENALSRNRDRNLRTLDALKAIGLRLAIDNFGAGASSLTGLQQLPIDTLKIDRSIVGGIGRGPRERPILGAVVELGHALGLQVVAEGVETVAQLQALRDAECDAAQGYLLARPVPEDQVRSLLAEHDDCASPDRSCS